MQPNTSLIYSLKEEFVCMCATLLSSHFSVANLPLPKCQESTRTTVHVVTDTVCFAGVLSRISAVQQYSNTDARLPNCALLVHVCIICYVLVTASSLCVITIHCPRPPSLVHTSRRCPTLASSTPTVCSRSLRVTTRSMSTG